MAKELDILRAEVRAELENDILPFWLDRMQDPAGGFYGQMDGSGRLIPDAPRGGILCARILWTFSSAYRVLGRSEYLDAARNAFMQIRDKFFDREFGGIYWSLNADGTPLDTKKQFYAIAFAVYGCAEFFRATGEEEALELAISLWRSIEDHSLDLEKGGYIEACTRDWQPIADMRLSEKDRNDAKTMNTHLHILEGHTGLYRVWKDETLRRRLVDLCEIFMDRIVRPDGHLGLFFDEDWRSQSDMVSYGHDIEASWLLCETAELLEDEALLARVRECCARIATASLEGLQPDGSMIYEAWPSSTPPASFTGSQKKCSPAKAPVGFSCDADRHWWVQAETVVGCLNQGWTDRAIRCWEYIKSHLIAPDGEWFWSIDAEGHPNTRDDRAGFWKCPYHNGRMCMEILTTYSQE
jgi:mannobiose 2-epimerase